MSEYDKFIEGFDDGLLQDPVNDPGPLSDEENQQLEESVVPATELEKSLDEIIAREEAGFVPGAAPVCDCGGNHSAYVGDTTPGAGHAVTCPVRIAHPYEPEAVVVDVVELTKQAWEEHRAKEREQVLFGIDEPPHEPDDWPEPPHEVELFPDKIELRALRPDQVPHPGQHYVIFNGKPLPVIRNNYAVSEDEHVRMNLPPADPSLKDFDGQRQQRADRTLRMRYRGYLCGELQGL